MCVEGETEKRDTEEERLRLYWIQLFYQILIIVRVSENYRNVCLPRHA